MIPVFQKTKKTAAIAQLEERNPSKVEVVGSNPTSGTFSIYVWFKNKCLYPHR